MAGEGLRSRERREVRKFDWIDLTRVWRSSVSTPFSRPRPDCLIPPTGISGGDSPQMLIQQMPASSA